MIKTRSWYGSKFHVIYTLVVFVILASLDIAAIRLIPSMVPQLTDTFGVNTFAIGALTAVQVIVTAVTAVGWGYLADGGTRKRLLFWGTIIWSVAMVGSAFTTTFWTLFAFQALAGVGLGSIASVGFSVISDFVAPKRRGLAMSFWGLSQGIGALAGTLLASQAGATSHMIPFLLLAFAGFFFAMLYLVTFEPPRGYAEPELAEFYDAGEEYEHTIDQDQLSDLAAIKTNRWLILQGLTAQIA